MRVFLTTWDQFKDFVSCPISQSESSDTRIDPESATCLTVTFDLSLSRLQFFISETDPRTVSELHSQSVTVISLHVSLQTPLTQSVQEVMSRVSPVFMTCLSLLSLFSSLLFSSAALVFTASLLINLLLGDWAVRGRILSHPEPDWTSFNTSNKLLLYKVDIRRLSSPLHITQLDHVTSVTAGKYV